MEVVKLWSALLLLLLSLALFVYIIEAGSAIKHIDWALDMFRVYVRYQLVKSRTSFATNELSSNQPHSEMRDLFDF